MEKIKRTLNFIFQHPLAGRHPYRSIARFVYWQVQCVLSPSSFKVKEFLSGIKFYVRKGAYGLTGNIYSGLHEFEDMAFLLHYLRPGDIFFDVGANVGSYTLLASGVCRARATVLEPVPATFNYLVRNIELNSLQGQTRLINAAAGPKEGTLTFTVNEDVTNHVITGGEENDNQIRVPVITIDSLIVEGEPNLIKIDVEGFETEVLKGMTVTLMTKSLKAIIIELNGSGGRYGFDESQIHRLLVSKYFKPYSYNPFNRKLTEQSTYGNHNTIYCRDIDFINKQLQGAPPFEIMGEII